MYDHLQDLYGPLYKYTDHKQCDQIRYRADDGQECHGEIIWVQAPGNTVSGKHLPALYVVERSGSGDSLPDLVAPSEVIAAASRNA